MIHIDVTKASKELMRAHRSLTGAAMNRAAASALNHTAAKAKTSISREVRSKYRMKAKDIKNAITLRKAYATNLEVAIRVTGKSLPLRAFPHRQVKSGVSVSVMGRRKIVKKAFVATMRNGHKGIFARGQYEGGKFAFRYKRIAPTGKPDLHITELGSASVPHALQHREILRAVARQIERDYPARLSHLLSRAAASSASAGRP